jgi:kynurenine formamidase
MTRKEIFPLLKTLLLVLWGNHRKQLLSGRCQTMIIIRKYSHTDPPFLAEDAALFLHESGIKHLLIDLPSVDKERMKENFWHTKHFGM